ncbi:HTH-type transcriptional repressor GamR [subsurface metagenome]
MATIEEEREILLDPNSKLPKYVQILNWLHGMISRGKIKVGDQIPTEEELSLMFGVNRMTVRKAIEELSLDKKIERKRGKGTFLIAAKPKDLVYKLEHISSFTDDMKALGITPRTDTRLIEVVEPNKDVRSILSLKKKEQVIYTLRVKYAEEEPVLIERSYLPYSEFKEILHMDLDGSLYHLLVENFNITLHQSTQIFSSILSSQEDTELFNLKQSCPCIMIESVMYDPNNIPIEILYSYFRGDKYKFRVSSGKYLFQR